MAAMPDLSDTFAEYINTSALAAELGISTGAVLPTHPDVRLEVKRFDIHKLGEGPGGSEEYIMSTLKYFVLDVQLVDAGGNLTRDFDGSHLEAKLLYEDGSEAEELSVSLEPPLLGLQAQVDGGVATFRSRITILSSLCGGKKFCVLVTLPSHPDIFCVTPAVKSITKLKRASRGGSAAAKAVAAEAYGDEDAPPSSPITQKKKPAPSTKRGLSASAEKGPQSKTMTAPAEYSYKSLAAPDSAARTSVSELRNAVERNSEKLHELERQQRALFAEVNAMRSSAAREDAAAAAVG